MRINKTDMEQELACIYTPDGRCRFTLTVERAAILYSQYKLTQATKPKLTKRLGTGTFAKELYALLCRYKDGASIDNKAQGKIKLANHWATPKEVYRVLQRHIGATKERFASPLNYSPEYAHYWSIHKRDQVFGAKCNAYKYQWTDAAVHNPEYEDQDLNKNVATAVAASQHTTEPVFGIHILPAWTDSNKTAYMRWVELFPANCRHVLQIPRQHFRFERPTEWYAGDRFAKSPRWDVNVLVTGNQAGFTKHFPYWDKTYMDTFLDDLQIAINATLPPNQQIAQIRDFQPQTPLASPTQQPSCSQLRQLGYPSARSYGKRKMDRPTHTEASSPNLQAESTREQIVSVLRAALPPAPPLKYDWTDFAYTDGSCLPDDTPRPLGSPGLGSGVYMPAKTECEEQKLYINPRSQGEGNENTINRAELVGILFALQAGSLCIATDSLSSMLQIRKQSLRPQELEGHKHQDLIKAIDTLICSSPEPIHLYKVTAHQGVVGNEQADEIAKAAAKGRAPDAQHHTYDVPSNSRTSMYWPVETVEKTPDPDGAVEEEAQDLDNYVIVCKKGKHVRCMTRPEAERVIRQDITGETYILQDRATPPAPAPKEQPVITKRPLEDLKGHLKKLSHKKCRLGNANRSTLYFEAWARTSEEREERESNHFMTSADTTHGVRKTVLKYRSGTLYNRKRAHWFKHADNSNCLLCGQKDGCHHTASGCPALSRLYTHRHNAIGRLILKAIMRGRKGAFVLMMDLGSDAHCSADGLVTHPHRIPAQVLPDSMSADLKALLRRQSVPDAFLYRPATPDHGAEYWIVEIKFCRDTDKAGQIERAMEQHKVLYNALRDADPNATVHYVPLVIGVAGSIFREMTHNLSALGVNGRDLKATTKAIHVKTTNLLHWIYTTKLKRERNKDNKAPWKRKRR
jgi:ribonuclease HI